MKFGLKLHHSCPAPDPNSDQGQPRNDLLQKYQTFWSREGRTTRA